MKMTGISLAAGLIFCFTANAQSQTPAPAPRPAARPPIASAKLASVTQVPLYFKAAQIDLAAGATSAISGGDGVLYQLSGSSEATLDGQTKTLSAGDGLYVPAGKTAQLKSSASSSVLHFVLATQANMSGPAETGSAKQIYQTDAPIPDLKPGAYDLNLTRVEFPAGMASTPPHHRTGAALYYVVSGAGANTIAGKAITRMPGTLIYEPDTLVHQWGNPGTEPLVFIAFNISPDGSPPVAMEKAP